MEIMSLAKNNCLIVSVCFTITPALTANPILKCLYSLNTVRNILHVLVAYIWNLLSFIGKILV